MIVVIQVVTRASINIPLMNQLCRSHNNIVVFSFTNLTFLIIQYLLLNYGKLSPIIGKGGHAYEPYKHARAECAYSLNLAKFIPNSCQT